MKGGSVHLQKFLDEPHFDFCEIISSQAAKLVGAHLMEFAAPEIAEVVTGKKRFEERGKECEKAKIDKTVA